MKRHLWLPVFLAGGMLWAHPMGNFSVSHYSRIEVTADGARVRYALDLAEIPTFELLQQWKMDAASPQAALDRKATEQAKEWSRHLKFAVDGSSARPIVEHARAVIGQGAGNMPILRVSADLTIVATPGNLTFEDDNYQDRAGWKEIVLAADKDARIQAARPAAPDRSKELTAYPQDPLAAPPQDLQAVVTWQGIAPAVTSPAVPVATAASPAASTPSGTQQPGQTGAGMVVKGDFLSRLLNQGQVGWGMFLLGMVVAFGLGAIHALSPGHGKTIVAAYLVGSRGTPRHAILLGAVVTFTHTISVFFLGFVTLFLSRYILPEKIYPVLGAISGLSIVWIGAALFFQRIKAATRKGRVRQHSHSLPEGEISLTGLIALGASGGLVPCPSALVLLLSSIALGRVALGLTLLVSFSMGLAIVLMGIGLVVLYAKHLVPDGGRTAGNAAFRYLPVASAAVIVCAGVLMTGVALGVIRPFAGI